MYRVEWGDGGEVGLEGWPEKVHKDLRKVLENVDSTTSPQSTAAAGGGQRWLPTAFGLPKATLVCCPCKGLGLRKAGVGNLFVKGLEI